MADISSLKAREILDSRGNPTIEVEVALEDRTVGRAAIPSGASTGRFEALELRDGDPARFHGKGVRKAIEHVEKAISSAVLGMDPEDQGALDRRMLELDGTENKHTLGANAILGVSLAAARAAARSAGRPLHLHLAELSGTEAPCLPIPLMNVVNGGRHADNGLDIQEYMIVPHRAERISEMVRMGSEVFQSLKEILTERGRGTAVGDEGGFAPQLDRNRQGIGLLVEAIERAGYRPGEQISVALDLAASEFYEGHSYRFDGSDLSAEELVERLEAWLDAYPLISIEDGLDQQDWAGWEMMTARLGERVQLIGDDLLVTDPNRLRTCIERHAANAILIKPNQIGTLTETLETIRLAKEAGFRTVISHRSGETEDAFIADLAVGTASGQIKTGSLSRGERTAKYNRLIRLEDRFGLPVARWEGLQ